MAKRSKTKKRPYLSRTLVVLECILKDKTKDPYKYMAGLFNLFNLRPENACDGCKHQIKNETVCGLSEIFKCPSHSDARHSIWQMTQSAKQLSPDLHIRLKDPENII